VACGAFGASVALKACQYGPKNCALVGKELRHDHTGPVDFSLRDTGEARKAKAPSRTNFQRQANSRWTRPKERIGDSKVGESGFSILRRAAQDTSSNRRDPRPLRRSNDAGHAPLRRTARLTEAIACTGPRSDGVPRANRQDVESLTRRTSELHPPADRSARSARRPVCSHEPPG
jgi:hypothetical protein